ncbi:hypothetical protein HAX54_029098 [Datura stramonium]|uniref:Uncharacterized protein n=1 Tax=Datura stramonium TaxID=4076 RepID=A0ABS8RKS5_DATST|nr:hypothetical protein [Datura stramonium]
MGYTAEHIAPDPMPSSYPAKNIVRVVCLPHALLEKEREMCNVEIRRLLNENKRLVEELIISQYELGVAREELHHMNFLIVDIGAQLETSLYKTYGYKFEANREFSAIKPLKNENSFNKPTGYTAEHIAPGPMPSSYPAKNIVRVVCLPHALLEKEREMCNVEIHRLLNENKRLVEERIISQYELGATRDELHRMNFLIADIEAQLETSLYKTYGNGLEANREFSVIKPLKNEVKHLLIEVMSFCTFKHNLLATS